MTANNQGTATVSKVVPSGAGGLTAWMQAAESGNTSNVVEKTVE
jgi:hypothetical protein